MASVIQELVYKDFDLKFVAHPVTGKLAIRKNTESIKQALRNLILTNLGERPYRPTFGSTIRSSLFENYTAFTEDNIRTAIKTAIANHEQRVELIDIRFGGDPDANQLNITIIFRPRNSVQVSELNISIDRVR